MRGEAIENPHGAITMFSMCASMKWAHLPLPGGIYDQDPELLRYWRIIWRLQAQKEAADEAKRKSEAARSKGRRGR